MLEAPSPAHEFFPVAVAFWAYLFLVGAILAGMRELGASDAVLLVALPLVGAVMLRAFVPVFRRLQPE